MYCEKNGIKYIHGCEVYLTEKLFHDNFDSTNEDEPYKVRDNYHTVLLAKNFEGLKELNTLVGLATQPDHFYYKPRLTFDEFLGVSDNIVKISACLASPLNKLMNTITPIKEKIESLQSQLLEAKEEDPNFDGLKIRNEILFNQSQIDETKDYFDKLLKHYDYYEIQYHNTEDQISFNKSLYDLSKKYNKPLIAGTDTHSLNSYKAECRSILQKSKKIEFSNEDDYDLTYKTYDELVHSFIVQNSLPMDIILEAIENTNVMASTIEQIVLDASIKYPRMYDNDEEVFIKRIDKMFKEKLKNGIIPMSQKEKFEINIQEEIRVFKKVDMLGFMLSMSEILCWCKENGIPIGFSRGSCGGSCVAYVTDVTDLNPIRWKTVFSRFCNEDRKEIGDIDIDVFKDDRAKIYEHIITHFGQPKTAFVLAMGTISDKGTIDDIGRALDFLWCKANPQLNKSESPYNLAIMKTIKTEYEANADKCREKYPKIFYYFEGMLGTIISQSQHPAGIVISPITLADNYGTFVNDGNVIMQLDMECVHETGLAKYDILGLKNVGIIKKTYEYIGEKYPLSYQIDWNDENVWADMKKSNTAIFQFESAFAFNTLKKFDAKSIEDMSLVTAMIRPSGASYRDSLSKHIINHNPSPIIDKLLEDNLGYLVYQEDVIKFLTDICGLSGSEADNTRRAIGRKDADRLQKALPNILEGYCKVSDKPREISEEEAKIFLKIIEDASSYMFGLNHSIAYCMLGYLCAYLRYYHPYEFLTAFLNCSETEEDISNGTELSKLLKIEIVEPKFRYGKSEYSFDISTKSIYKGMQSIKFLNKNCADDLYSLRNNTYNTFTDLLYDIRDIQINSRQLEILIKLDFFEEFGNSMKLLRIVDMFDFFKQGNSKTISKTKLESKQTLYNIVLRNSTESEKSFTKLNVRNILQECDDFLNCQTIQDFSYKDKILTQLEFLGYINLCSHSQEEKERRKLVVLEIRPIIDRFSKVPNKVWKYSLRTQSIGSGKHGAFYMASELYEESPIEKYDIIFAEHVFQNKGYWNIGSFHHI